MIALDTNNINKSLSIQEAVRTAQIMVACSMASSTLELVGTHHSSSDPHSLTVNPRGLCWGGTASRWYCAVPLSSPRPPPTSYRIAPRITGDCSVWSGNGHVKLISSHAMGWLR